MEREIFFRSEHETIFCDEFDADILRGKTPPRPRGDLLPIRAERPAEELRRFLADLGRSVPLICAKTGEKPAAPRTIPPDADFAVCTSGTTARPKVHFRTLKSWTGFFPIQNEAFGVTGRTRLFLHGTFSFTGNLNIALQAAHTGARVFSSESMNAGGWKRAIAENGVNALYLVPSKLAHLCKTGAVFGGVETIISGSDLIPKELCPLIARSFPNARLFLYYGSSEASYISFREIDARAPGAEALNCVGTPFKTVDVSVSEDGRILVRSDCLVCGKAPPLDTGDRGFLKDGKLFFLGRSDDLLNISGEKIEKSVLAERLRSVPGIEECDITVKESGARTHIVAHIAGGRLPSAIDPAVFRGIPSVLVPKEYVRYRRLPRNGGGKVCVGNAPPRQNP